MFNRLFSQDDEEHDLEATLQEEPDDSMQVTTVTADVSLELLSSEFDVLEPQKKRAPNLEMLYQALLTIKPSSVKAERQFSTAGNFATKIPSRLSDRSLCALVFLKKYFLLIDNVSRSLIDKGCITHLLCTIV